MARQFLCLGAINAALAVILGAFGAHGLKGDLAPAMLEVYRTGVHYHFLHALGLGLIGLLALRLPASGLLRAAGWTMFAGILLFSGSLYVLALSRTPWVGFITPFGGLAFIVSWLLVAVATYREL